MPNCFVIRSGTLPIQKPWILSEIRVGRLRQGVFAHKGMSLVDSNGKRIDEKPWALRFQAHAKRQIPKPATDDEEYDISIERAREKYSEFKIMLEISEGSQIVVPKLYESSKVDGFTFASAASAPSDNQLKSGSYWFDSEQTDRRSKGFGHVVAVEPESVCHVQRDSSELSKEIFKKLFPYRKSVNRVDNAEFAAKVEQLHKEALPVVQSLSNGEEDKTERDKVLADIDRRRGQSKFRQDLIDHYRSRCAISGCEAEPALEAAHIKTFEKADLHHVTNGLLLRADLHTLFDLHYVSIRTSDWTVVVANSLLGTSYKELNGKRLDLPINKKAWPKRSHLDEHYKEHRSKFKG